MGLVWFSIVIGEVGGFVGVTAFLVVFLQEIVFCLGKVLFLSEIVLVKRAACLITY